MQSSIGFGMAVVAAPFIIFFTPELMPGALLVTSFSLPVVQLRARARATSPGGPWAGRSGRACSSPPSGWRRWPCSRVRAISVVTGLLILLTVAASVSALEVRATPLNSAVAGGIAGFSGTATSIGGPFLALVLQHERPARLRATLSAFFLVGAMMAVAGLGVAGEFTRHQLIAGVAWVPFIGVGYALAAPARARLDRDRLRKAVLVFCVVASVSVIVRAVV